MLEWPWLVALVLVGLLAGFISSLMGVGGGIVMTPFLHFVVGYSWIDSVATSLLAIAIQSPLGVWRHARRGTVDWRLALALASGGVAGVWLGDRLLPHIPVAGLKILFAGLLVFAAWRLVGRVPAPRTGRHPFSLLVLMGTVAGLVSRILGVGGGILTVPALALLGFPVHVAVASSLVPVFTNAALASGASLARGLDVLPGFLLAAGALPGAWVGAHAAHALPERGLRRVVAGALVVVAALVAATAT